MSFRIVCISIFLWISAGLIAQDAPHPYAQIQGDPFIQNFSPKDYNGFSQNWQVIQDPDGIIYIANNFGLLSYDGVRWEKHSTQNLDLVRAIMQDSLGRIFVGGRKDMGYFHPDSIGTLAYHSLTGFIPDSLKAPGAVYAIYQHQEGIYFCASNNLYKWDEAKQTMEVPLPHTNVSQSFQVGDELYIKIKDKGLCLLKNDQLVVLPGTNFFKRRRVHAIIPMPQKQDNGKAKLLIGTSLDGIYTYDGKEVKPFSLEPDAAAHFKKYPIYTAHPTQAGDILFANLSGGLAVLGLDGKLKQVYDTSSGMKEGLVLSAFEDKAGAIWCTLSDGISYIEASSPFSFFGEDKDIQLTTDIVWHQGHLYVGGEKGLYKISGRKYQAGTITTIPTDGAINWRLTSSGDRLFAISSSGSFELDTENNVLDPITFIQGTAILYTQVLPECLIIGQQKQLVFLTQKQGKWIKIGTTPKLSSFINTLVETNEGILWGGIDQGLVRIEISPDTLRKRIQDARENTRPLHQKFDEFNQFKGQSRVFPGSQEPYFCNKNGLYKFKDGEFYQDDAIEKVFADTSRQVLSIHEDAKHRFWIENFEKNARGFGVFGLNHAPQGISLTQSIKRVEYLDQAWSVYTHPEVPDIGWLATNGGLIRYDLNKRLPSKMAFSPILSRVTANQNELIKGNGTPVSRLTLPYARQALRFEFALPVFDAPEQARYRYWLEGFDEDWSKFSFETQKDYTNLSEGNYTFWVQAQDAHGRWSQKSGWEFKILPPWYRTWWAYILYFLLGGLSIYAFIQWRLKRLKQKNIELEAIIEDRTAEIRKQKEQLEELDKEKARFFTNISHEFRTPLSVISGVVDLIPGANKEKKLIRRNAENLLNLVNQILDLRKLESGKLSLDLHQDDIVAYLKYISESFQSLAEKKDIELHFEANPTEILMDYDKKKILRIISNLLSNAIKFTPREGNVSIRVQSSFESEKNGGTRTKEQAHNRLFIDVTDSGVGIEEGKLPYIFNHFYQVDSSSTRAEEGTGIGLTLVAELIKLMEGEIQVSSKLGQGTTFKLVLPLTREAERVQTENQEFDVNKLAGMTVKNSPLESIHLESKDDLPNLLIVEDNPDVMQYLIACLQDRYNLSLANDGQEGIEMAILQVPDIIISDVMMPRKDGFELCDTLKRDERTSHIPIILLTARADDDSRVTGLERGADAYLAKPFNQQELFVRLRKLLELRQKLQNRYLSGTPLSPTNDPVLQQEDEFITKIRDLIMAHLDEGEFGTNELCLELGVSRSQLYNKIKALTGRSVAIYIRFIRLQQAKEMLGSTDLPVSEIAYATGFSDPSYFSRVFNKEFGTRPNALRK